MMPIVAGRTGIHTHASSFWPMQSLTRTRVSVSARARARARGSVANSFPLCREIGTAAIVPAAPSRQWLEPLRFRLRLLLPPSSLSSSSVLGRRCFRSIGGSVLVAFAPMRTATSSKSGSGFGSFRENNNQSNNNQNNNNNNNDDDQTQSQKGAVSSSFVVCKERFSKAYRHPDLDARLTKSRCRSEAKLLGKCATKSEIRVPRVLKVSPPSLYLEYLAGPSVKSYLQLKQREQIKDPTNDVDNDDDGKNDAMPNKDNNCSSNTEAGSNRDTDIPEEKTIPQKNDIGTNVDGIQISRTGLARQMGQLLGRLHNIGIVHGDLTTSNMMLLERTGVDKSKDDNNGDDNNDVEDSFELALIDFGLSKSSTSVEEQAVDLYVLERALLSTHPDLPKNFFDLVLEQYKSTTEIEVDANNDDAGNGKKRKNNNQTTLERLEKVRMRGRKRECFG
mmetsp:Transcript_25409/g.52881  ORF Transcript_25409/g.52881 Transcript_25409/m.52881 type:complete len:448 (+) Transcript_25409:228-1571(+)